MPTRCIANKCKSTTNVNKKCAAQIELEKVMKVTFHSFPCNPVRRADWIRILKLEDKNINNRSRLCCLHFQEKYIDRTSLVYVRLRENAVPHIFENTLHDEMEDQIALTPIKFLNIKVERKDDLNQIPIIYSKCNKGTNTSSSLLQEIRNPTQDKETRISPERIWNMNSPSMAMIKKARHTEIENLRKKIKVLQQKVWRKDKKIAVMKTILDELIENLVKD